MEEIERNLRSSIKSIKKIEAEVGMQQPLMFKTFNHLMTAQVKDKRAKDDLAEQLALSGEHCQKIRQSWLAFS